MAPVACGRAGGAATLARARSRSRSVTNGMKIVSRKVKEIWTYNTLDAVEVVLDLGALPDEPAERLLDADDVAEHDACLRGRDREARRDGEDGDDEGEEDAHAVEADAEPALICHG